MQGSIGIPDAVMAASHHHPVGSSEQRYPLLLLPTTLTQGGGPAPYMTGEFAAGMVGGALPERKMISRSAFRKRSGRK